MPRVRWKSQEELRIRTQSPELGSGGKLRVSDMLLIVDDMYILSQVFHNCANFQAMADFDAKVHAVILDV